MTILGNGESRVVVVVCCRNKLLYLMDGSAQAFFMCCHTEIEAAEVPVFKVTGMTRGQRGGWSVGTYPYSGLRPSKQGLVVTAALGDHIHVQAIWGIEATGR